MNRSMFRFAVALAFTVLMPAVALAEGDAVAVSPYAPVGKALAIGLAGLGSGWAMSRIGAAGIGAIAENQSNFGPALTLMALSESIVILGFVIAILI